MSSVSPTLSANRPLQSRIALITGASAGIGLDCALHLAFLGAKLILNARREPKLLELAQRIDDQYPTDDSSPRCTVVAGDAADQTTIDQMIDAAKTLDPNATTPDIVVVNAGRGLNGSVMTSDTTQWEEMVRTNLLGAARLIRSAGQSLTTLQDSRDWPQGGPADIVVLGSTVGRHISPFSSMYGSTKFAVNSLAEAARRELGPKGIRVTLIEPGIVKSEFQQVAGYDETSFGNLMDTISPVLVPIDIARTIGFIISQPAGVHISDAVIRPTRPRNVLQILAASMPVEPTTAFRSSANITMTANTTDPIVSNGLPASFSMPVTSFSGTETFLAPKENATIFYDSDYIRLGETSGAVVGWDICGGRVINLSTTVGVAQINDPNFQILMGNLVTWVTRSVQDNSCPADIAAPCGALNFFDVSAFLARFSAQDMRADLNNDGNLNFFDISAFLNIYSGGCP